MPGGPTHLALALALSLRLGGGGACGSLTDKAEASHLERSVANGSNKVARPTSRRHQVGFPGGDRHVQSL